LYNNIILDRLRVDKLPTMWCPGCGHGIILAALLKSIDKMGWEKENTVVVSGIGCAGRVPGYIDACTLHTTHGRALGFATGIKFAHPELNVIAVMGDGDASAIGGNHLIHAARRNIDITAIVFNNDIYGMTGGQKSPTTPHGYNSTTSQYGNAEIPFDLCKLVEGAGATFVAREIQSNHINLEKIILKALQKKGFSFVEAFSVCPTSFGRRNKLTSDATKNIDWVKSMSVTKAQAEKRTPEELEGKIITGVFVDIERPEFIESYLKYDLSGANCEK